jgi:F-type H+-transporting ATPase subunit epsilon
MGGFAEVDQDEVTVLVNGAEQGSAIDLEDAKSALSQAEARLGQLKEDEKQEKIQATQALKRARARVQAAGGVVPV